jgi:DNA repair protein RadB
MLDRRSIGDRRVFVTAYVGEAVSEPLSTGCEAIDDLLGGGLARGVVTQVYGPPAAGKTNLALSSAVAAAAKGDSVLYVDTEGLSIDRFEQLVSAHAATIDGDAGGDHRGVGHDGWTEASEGTGEGEATEAGENGDDGADGGDSDLGRTSGEEGIDGNVGGGETGDGNGNSVIDDIASRIVITDALDFAEQEEAVRDAAEFAERVDLIVLDSATGHYRLERSGNDEGETLRKVARQVTHLLSLARKHDLAVLITNQVYTDPDADRVRPLGGHTLAHWSGVVLRIERFRSGQRRATLEKHESKAAGEIARFRITEAGLEVVEDF